MSASIKPPNSAELTQGAMTANESADTRQASLIEYPCDFPVKVMGASVPGFAEAMAELVQQHDPCFSPATIEMRPSKAGNYLSLTLTIRATSRSQLDNLYLALTSHPMVKVAL
jgi:hypothetical protein